MGQVNAVTVSVGMSVCVRLGVKFTVSMFIMGHRYSNKEKAKCVLLNFLFAQLVPVCTAGEDG